VAIQQLVMIGLESAKRKCN